MIFVTVGTQLPFDRLISAVDQWANVSGRKDVFSQTGGGRFIPSHMSWKDKITPGECRKYMDDAELIVAHAGMGTIISALEAGKPIVILPRLFEHGEHRNDHQVATCERFANWDNVFVASSVEELPEKIEAALACPIFKPTVIEASEGLLQVVDDFLIEARRLKDVDGIICFGGVDWWDDTRGHAGIQLMRELSKRMPVLYVNPIGMQPPIAKISDIFGRIARTLRGWMRGLKIVEHNFGVLSPASISLFHRTPLGKSLVANQAIDAAQWMGFKHPLLWIAWPPAAEFVERIPSTGMVYQRTERTEQLPGVRSKRLRECDLTLKKLADLTLFCSSSVYNDERGECRNAAIVDHGVDYDLFSESAARDNVPKDVEAISRPRIGFVGDIASHTFDSKLFMNVATAMPECSFVLVGGCSLPQGWCPLSNVHLLGRKPYEQVADYMAACDVLIMPWNSSPWIKACNPVKLKEYLAVGRPVVSTPFDELAHYTGFVSVATDAQEFTQEIRNALEKPSEAKELRKRVEQETWAAKASAALDKLQEIGVHFQESVANEESGSEAPMTLEITKPVDSAKALPAATGDYWKKSTLVTAALFALVGVWATSDAWRDIFGLASRDEESSHIFLALPAAFWLVWVRRLDAAQARRTGTWLGPAMVALGWLLFAVGDVQLYQSMWHFGAIMIMAGCLISVLGREVLFKLWPAFVILVFLIPVPGIVRAQIASPMQTVTAQMTASVLQTIGEPVTLSGKVLIVNGVSVGIAEACNGIRMVFALALVCFFYAFSTELKTGTRLLIILASPLIAILVNIVRLVPTVWLYGHATTETAVLFHDVMGWAMMPVALFGMMGVNSLIAWAIKEDPVQPSDVNVAKREP